MAPVRWETVPQPTYDDMVAVLLSSLHPQAERLDGRGGDGGRDVQIRHDDGRLDLLELKSFTGRLGWKPNRRGQVERSLRKAAQHNPDSWTLVVPIDHNREELAWFDGLRRHYRFPLAWSGRTWLDRQMANHSAIVRYYLEDGDSEAMRLLRELNREQANLAGGFPDALERLRVLKQRIDEVVPHYWLDIAMVGDTITMGLRPRYRGAERDHPILINTAFAFPDTRPGRRPLSGCGERWTTATRWSSSPTTCATCASTCPAGSGRRSPPAHGSSWGRRARAPRFAWTPAR